MALPIRRLTLVILIVAQIGIIGFSQSPKNLDQNPPSLLLPEPLHVTGQVVGEDGNPIAKVRLYHINLPGDLVTDSNGQFAFDTSAPAFVVQMPGFQSVFVRTSDASSIRILLRRIPRSPSFPVCSKSDLSDRAPGWRGVLQIPNTQNADVSREALDVDYSLRTIRVKSGSVRIQVAQGRGPMWGGGQPEDEQVWRSTRYSEKTYDLGGMLLTDAKGRLPNDRCWREVGVFSESAFYSDIDCSVVEPLDRILDELCVIPGASKNLLP
ncbi:MAG: carboxypeptidase-like regulatory domain-containing protein [Terracidiphilus sp.]|jgi:hypothetical protein